MYKSKNHYFCFHGKSATSNKYYRDEPKRNEAKRNQVSNYLMHTQNKSATWNARERGTNTPLPFHHYIWFWQKAAAAFVCLSVRLFLFMFMLPFLRLCGFWWCAGKSLCRLFLSLAGNHSLQKCDAIVGAVDVNLIMKNELNGVNAVLLCVRVWCSS